MASCGGALVKIVLSIFNLIWMAAGALIFYMGFKTMSLTDDSFKDLIEYNFKTGALVLLALGLAILIISLIGFCGACCEHAGMLNFYATILFILLIVNVAAVYYGHNYQDEFKYKLDKGIKNGIKNFDNDPKLAYALQSIQKTFECCGWDGPTDYGYNINYPSSCCDEEISRENPTARCPVLSLKFTKGCKESPTIAAFSSKIFYSFYFLILIQLLIILASCCLARDLNQ